jgi:hypothetical protein
LVLLSDSKLPSVLKIAAGGLDWNAGTEGVQSIAVYNIYVFDGYNSTFKLNDIALLKVGKRGENTGFRNIAVILCEYCFYFVQ